jgi:hypothetical protein
VSVGQLCSRSVILDKKLVDRIRFTWTMATTKDAVGL